MGLSKTSSIHHVDFADVKFKNFKLYNPAIHQMSINVMENIRVSKGYTTLRSVSTAYFILKTSKR